MAAVFGMMALLVICHAILVRSLQRLAGEYNPLNPHDLNGISKKNSLEFVVSCSVFYCISFYYHKIKYH